MEVIRSDDDSFERGRGNCSGCAKGSASSGTKVVERGRHMRSVYKYIHRYITSPPLAARKTVLSSVN